MNKLCKIRTWQIKSKLFKHLLLLLPFVKSGIVGIDRYINITWSNRICISMLLNEKGISPFTLFLLTPYLLLHDQLQDTFPSHRLHTRPFRVTFTNNQFEFKQSVI